VAAKDWNMYENRETMHADGTSRVGGVSVHPGALRRISWGAILAGVVMVLAIQLLLSLLGIGIGMGVVEPGSGENPAATSLGIGSAVWWVVSNLIALFVGGYVAARLAGVFSRGDGMLHGLLTWAFSLLVTFYLLTSAVGSVIGGAYNVVGNALGTAGQTIQQAIPSAAQAVSGAAGAPNFQDLARQLLDPNARPQGPEAAQRDLVTALGQMAASGDPAQREQARDRAVGIIAQQAGVPEDQARQRLDQMTQQVQEFRQQATQTATRAADVTADTLSQASIWAFVALLLGAIAGALGGRTGTREQPVVTEDVSYAGAE